MYRLKELKEHGEPDVNGVLNTPKEKLLTTIEQFFDCLLTGYIIRHVYLDSKKMIDE